MADAAPGGPCDQCEGTGVWAGGCDVPDDCWQCHGTGIQRARGNCEDCLGWGWSFGAARCARCHETGWIAEDVALYWCAGCLRTIASSPASPACPRDTAHAIERVTARR